MGLHRHAQLGDLLLFRLTVGRDDVDGGRHAVGVATGLWRGRLHRLVDEQPRVGLSEGVEECVVRRLLLCRLAAAHARRR